MVVVGEDSGIDNVRKQKTQEVLYIPPHPHASISEQEGLVVVVHGRLRPGTHISWFASLPFSSETFRSSPVVSKGVSLKAVTHTCLYLSIIPVLLGETSPI